MTDREKRISALGGIFECGVEDFFKIFGRRKACELTMQAWLAISLAEHCCPQRILAEIHINKADLLKDAPDTAAVKKLKETGTKKKISAMNFDMCLGLSDDVDARKWQTIKKEKPESYTKYILKELAVVSELKISLSSETKKIRPELLSKHKNPLTQDLAKLLSVAKTLRSMFPEYNKSEMPKLYQIILVQNFESSSPDKITKITDRHKEALKECILGYKKEWCKWNSKSKKKRDHNLPKPVILLGGAIYSDRGKDSMPPCENFDLQF